jgi:hypothetical protein
MSTLIPAGYRDEIEQIDRGIYEFRTVMPFFFDDFRPVRVEFRLSEIFLRPEITQVELGSRPDMQGRIVWLDVTDQLYGEQIRALRHEIEATMQAANMADAAS